MVEADRRQESAGAGRLLLRAAVGAVALVRERVSRAAQPSPTGQERRAAVRSTGPQARHIVIGLFAAGPALTRRVLRRYTRRGPARAPSPADRMLVQVSRTRPARMVARWHRTARARLAHMATELAAVGAAEEREGRDLLAVVVSASVDEAVDRLAGNPQIRQVIREQSVGLTEGAVVEMREQSARADDFAEAAVRRLFHRRLPTPDPKHG
jgi:hypothetical protein